MGAARVHGGVQGHSKEGDKGKSGESNGQEMGHEMVMGLCSGC